MNLLITNVRIPDDKATGKMKVPHVDAIRQLATEMYPQWRNASELDLIRLYVQSQIAMSAELTYNIAGETNLPIVKPLDEYSWDAEVFELQCGGQWIYYETTVDPDYVIYVSDEYHRSEITLHDAVINDLLHRLNFTTSIFKRL